MIKEFTPTVNPAAEFLEISKNFTDPNIVVDLRGEKRIMRITPPQSDDENPYTKHMLVSDTSDHNIEVFVLKDFFEERMKIEFRPRTKE